MQARLTATRPSPSARRLDGVLEWARAFSGIGLALFIFTHMLLVGSVLLSPALMDAIARFLEDNNVAQVGGPLIFALLFAHVLLAARRLPLHIEEQKTLLAHAARLHHADTWLWVAQAATGAVVLGMGAFHIWTMLTSLPITALRSAEMLHANPWWLAFFLLLAPLAHAHLGLGLYRIAVKWGFAGRAQRHGLKRFVTGLILVLTGLSMMTLSRFWFMGA
jgi:fumarate reductase subunit C